MMVQQNCGVSVVDPAEKQRMVQALLGESTSPGLDVTFTKGALIVFRASCLQRNAKELAHWCATPFLLQISYIFFKNYVVASDGRLRRRDFAPWISKGNVSLQLPVCVFACK